MAKYTKDQVIKELKEEFQKLSKRNYSLSGDVNYKEHGGIRYRKSKSGNSIDAISYYGLDNIPEGCGIDNVVDGCFDLDELIEQIDDIWSSMDVGNCGLNIGWLIAGIQSYDGSLFQM